MRSRRFGEFDGRDGLNAGLRTKIGTGGAERGYGTGAAASHECRRGCHPTQKPASGDSRGGHPRKNGHARIKGDGRGS